MLIFVMKRVKYLLNQNPLPFSFLTAPKPNEENRPVDNNHRFCPYQSSTDLTYECMKKSGFKPVLNMEVSNCFIGKILPDEDFVALKPWQKANHFFGVEMIGRKDEFHQRIQELTERMGPEETKFYQETYLLPDDFDKIIPAWPTSSKWILKPRASSKGQNIEVRDSSEQSYPPYPYLVQRYLDRPFLILGRKFDIRFYFLVTGVSPMRIYSHRHGLGLFCTVPYDKDAGVSEQRMHITNWEVNKGSTAFVRPQGIEERPEDSKWSLPFFFKYMQDNGYDAEKLKKSMEYACVKAVIAGMDKVRDTHIKNIKDRHISFELLGIDMLLDENLNTTVVEVNVSPGMVGTDSALDKYMKTEVLLDTYNMARIVDVNPYQGNDEVRKIHQLETRSVSAERRRLVEEGSIKPWDDPVFMDVEIVREFIDENERARGYHIVYPVKDTMMYYEKCFTRKTYEDIVLRDWVLMNDTEKEAAMGRALVSYQHFMTEALETKICRI